MQCLSLWYACASVSEESTAEYTYQYRYAHLESHAECDGQRHDILVVGLAHDRGQAYVHRVDAGDGYWGISAAPAGEERSPEQGRHLAYDVGEQGYRGELGGVGGGTLHVGDEHRREGVVSEPAAESETVGKASVPEQEYPCGEKSSVPMMVAAGSRIMPAPNDCFMCCRSFEAPRPMPT